MSILTPIPDGGVASARGFQASAAACGIKQAGRLDLALIDARQPCAAAGVFTRNQVVAAPVTLCRQLLATDPTARAVLINAGNANAVTGAAGLEAARRSQAMVARQLDCEPGQVLVMSTGVIGVPLPLERLEAGIAAAAPRLGPDGHEAAQAIMTTDTRPKEAAVRVALSTGVVTIGGMAKGAGMIHPDMATMLALVTTDAAIPAGRLQRYLEAAIAVSFNRISVDGDTSTNDTVLLLANGASGLEPAGVDEKRFEQGLAWVCTGLARQIVRDGEGASKFVTIRVSGAADDDAAHAVANTIAISPLVKTAFAGSDPNWGRILMAAGRAGVPLEVDRLTLWIDHDEGHQLALMRGGAPTDYQEADAAAIFARPEFTVHLDLGQAAGEATVWTCDLSHDYISINADYRT